MRLNSNILTKIRVKGRTIRKVKREGIFSLHEFFSFYPLLVQDVFFRVKPSARIFLLDKYLFVWHLLNYFTKNGVFHRFNTSEYG